MIEPATLALVALVGAAVGFVLGFIAGRDERRAARSRAPRARVYAHLSRSVLSCQACAEEYSHARLRAGQLPPAREIIPNGSTTQPRCEICGCLRARYALRIPLPDPCEGNRHV